MSSSQEPPRDEDGVAASAELGGEEGAVDADDGIDYRGHYGEKNSKTRSSEKLLINIRDCFD